MTDDKATIAALEQRVRDAQQCLRDHHQWHLDAGTIGLPDGEGGWVEIDDAAEYGDSLLFERTQKVLEGFPADDAGPMPRGGISAWWWAQGVLERRKRKAAEREAAALRETVAWEKKNAATWTETAGVAIRRYQAAEAERDTLAAQVEGFRDKLGDALTDLIRLQQVINGVRAKDDPEAVRIAGMVGALGGVTVKASPSPVSALIEAGRLIAKAARMDDRHLDPQGGMVTLWFRTDGDMAKFLTACAAIIEKEKTDD